MQGLVNDFKLNGYTKFQSESQEHYKLFEECIHRVLKEHSVDGRLETLHERVAISDLNKLRLKIFNELNSLPDWEDKFASLAIDVIKELIGLDLSIQTKLNLSIQFPGDETSLQPLHTDRSTGHSLFEMVLWVSFTKSQSTAAMYILDVPSTLNALAELPRYEKEGYSKFQEKYEKEKKYIAVVPGDCILFSSNLYHGNTVNETKETRVSINCRFKSLWAPELNDFANERITGSFYKPYKLGPCTEFNLQFVDREPKFNA